MLQNEPAHLIDLMPTCLELAQAEYPEYYKGRATQPMEGVSLLPAFDGKTLGREAIYFEHEGNRAVRMGISTLSDGTKSRFCKKCKEMV